LPHVVSHATTSSCAECSSDRLPLSFVNGQESTIWDIILTSPQEHKSVSVCRHFFLRAPQWPCAVQKR